MKRKKDPIEEISKQLRELGASPDMELSDNLDDNEAAIRQPFSNSADLVVRRIYVFNSVPCLAVFLDGLVDDNLWENGLLKPLMAHQPPDDDSTPGIMDMLKYRLSSVVKPEVALKLNDAVRRIVNGEVVLFVQSSRQAVCFKIKDILHRQLDEPSTEAVIRGPRVGFIEKLNINMALIRQRIRTPLLKMEKMTVGSITQSEVTIVYIEKLASQRVVDEIKQRISMIDAESVTGSGYLEEMICDHPNSPFPVIQATERPDVVAGALIEGKVAVMVDGSPFVLIAPITFWHAFQTVEDYYISYIFATSLRWLRYFFGFLALALPSLFIAVTTFHQEMIPTSLAMSLAAAREVVPFPALAETLIMEVTFDALREAGVRLPRPVGQTISIVGALVIGQAAVQAGIISAPIIIIVSLTGIASFLIPHPAMSQAISILRYPMMLAAGSFGLYGAGAVMLAILIHLTNLHSFGIPYLSPIAPFNASGLLDVLFRAPWQVLNKRHQRLQYIQQKQKLELEKK